MIDFAQILNNLAFASFGKKDTPYEYLFKQFKKQ